MITVTSAQLSAWLGLFVYPLTRILALVASAPVLGDQQIPIRVKIGLALMLTIIIAPTLGPLPQVDVGSALGFVVLLQQILAGLAIGFTMRLIFAAVEMSGEIAGMQMGLGFASFFDPVNASFLPVVAQFMTLIATLAFLAMNGHLYLLEALAESFQMLPIAPTEPHAGALHAMVIWGSSIFMYALQLSMPLIGALLLTNLALAILTRSAPQLNIFQIGFPLTIAVGLAILALTLPYITPVLENVMHISLDTSSRIIQQLGKP
jgi:flagellar biosynthesis protein FliR